MASIEKVSGLSSAEFKAEFMDKARPVILKDAAAHWSAMQSWNEESFLAGYGSELLPVEVLPDDKGYDNAYRMKNLRFQSMTIADYLTLSKTAGSRYYLAQVPIDKLGARMQKDVGDIKLMPPNAKAVEWLAWIGHKKAGSGLHYDMCNNFHILVAGQKKWTIFSPDDMPNIYLPHKTMGIFSPISLETIDAQKFPRYARAKPIEFVISPGETLYLPKYWAHNVESLGFTASINCFFRVPTAMEYARDLRYGALGEFYGLVLNAQRRLADLLPSASANRREGA